MSDRVFSKKRPRWVVWVPTLVLVALIVGAGVLAALVSSGSLGRDDPPTVAEAVTENGYSRFSEDGIAYVRDSLQARIDLSDPEPEAAGLGLPADGRTIVDGGGFSISVGLYVEKESIRIPTSTIALSTRDGRLVSLSLATSGGSYQAQRALLASIAKRFAIDGGDLSDLDSRVTEAVRTEQTEEFAFGPGTGFGRAATATLVVRGSDSSELELSIDFSS